LANIGKISTQSLLLKHYIGFANIGAEDPLLNQDSSNNWLQLNDLALLCNWSMFKCMGQPIGV
jgi:hypothetical protein